MLLTLLLSLAVFLISLSVYLMKSMMKIHDLYHYYGVNHIIMMMSDNNWVSWQIYNGKKKKTGNNHCLRNEETTE